MARYEIAIFNKQRLSGSNHTSGGTDGDRTKAHFLGATEFDDTGAALHHLDLVLQKPGISRVEFHDRQEQHRIIYGTA